MADRGVDIVIRGAGLQALTKAVALAESGKKVLVVEQGPKPGGRISAFRRGRYEFETGFPGGGESSLRYADAVALDARLRELGGEVRYDRAAAVTEKNAVTLSDGTVIPCGEAIAVFGPDEELVDRTFTVFLGLDVPAEALDIQSGTAGGIRCRVLPTAAGVCALRLTKLLPEGAFDAVTEAVYFSWKDRVAREIVEDFEKETGADIRNHIEEMDAATPATWARRLLPPDHPGHARRLANAIHPAIQHAVVAEVTEREYAKSFRLVPDAEKGTEKLAVFRAGQYITLKLDIGGRIIWKPYSIQSGPGAVLAPDGGGYTITIRRALGGLGSEFVLDHKGGSLRAHGRFLLFSPPGRPAGAGTGGRERHHALLLPGQRHCRRDRGPGPDHPLRQPYGFRDPSPGGTGGAGGAVRREGKDRPRDLRRGGGGA